jgi:hypothetical protein
LNVIGDGQPDVHNPYTNNEFLDTRGLPSAATGLKASYILQRLAAISEALGTKVEVMGDTAHISLGNDH